MKNTNYYTHYIHWSQETKTINTIRMMMTIADNTAIPVSCLGSSFMGYIFLRNFFHSSLLFASGVGLPLLS